MRVEVVYALPDVQTVVTVEVSAGARVADVLAAVAHRPPFSSLDLTAVPVGIFGETVARDTLVHPNDRIEIYRPLATDPKDARRLRAGRDG